MRDISRKAPSSGVTLASVLATAFAITPSAAQAQAVTTTTDSGWTRGGEDIVVTASRASEGIPANQLGASVTILDAEVLEQRQTRILSDILRDVPGVAVNRTGVVGGPTQIRVRGTEGNHVLVLIDGIEAADPYQGEFDFATLLADPAARVEVLRGQQSSLYGSDAIGGVIHYMTLTGAEAPGLSLRAEAGSFETVTVGARAAGVSEDLDYALSGSYFHTGGTPTARNGTRDVGSDLGSLSGKVIWSPTQTFSLTGVVRYSSTEAESNNSENDPSSPLFGYTVDSPGVSFKNKALYGLVRAEVLALDGRWSSSLTGQIADTTRDNFAADPARPGNSLFDYGEKGQRLKGSFVSSLRLGSERLVHRLTGAVDVERESFRNTSPEGSGAFTGERHTDNIGLVGQYELLWDQALSLGASIRHDDNNRFGDATTYRVQGSYSFAFGTRMRGAWGTGVKNPGYFELYGYSDGRYIGNPNLKPEMSKGWEIGLEQSFGALATIGATYFKATLQDEIYTTYPPPNYIATPGNRATDSRQKGVELFLSARPTPQIRLDAAYTWLNAEENGVAEVRRPEHIASFNATAFSTDKRFSGTLTVRYNGEMIDVAYTDPSYAPVRETLDDFWLVNLSGEVKLSPTVSLTARVENLFDENHEEVFSFATPGISAFGGVTARF